MSLVSGKAQLRMLRPQGRTLLLALHLGEAAGPLGAGLWGFEGWTQGQGIQLAPHVSPTALPTPPPAGGGGTSLPSPAASVSRALSSSSLRLAAESGEVGKPDCPWSPPPRPSPIKAPPLPPFCHPPTPGAPASRARRQAWPREYPQSEAQSGSGVTAEQGAPGGPGRVLRTPRHCSVSLLLETFALGKGHHGDGGGTLPGELRARTGGWRGL